MIKKFALLKLFPSGMNSGNVVVNETTSDMRTGAICLFQNLYPELNLDERGYSKIGDLTYCVAEYLF